MKWFTRKIKEEVKEKQQTDAPAVVSEQKPTRVSSVLVKPLVSEKASVLASKNQYTFIVDKTATRIDVRHAFRQTYGFLPVSVNMQRVDGKAVRFGGRFGKRKDWKKAIVTVPKGKTINVYEGI